MRGLTPGYVIRRLGMYVLTIWLGAPIIFLIPRLAPGDPVAAMVSRISAQAGFVEGSPAMIEAWRVRFGLDAPVFHSVPALFAQHRVPSIWAIRSRSSRSG